jgi:uncharacterized glyoxalase superfamily protein PhnB
LQAAQIGNSTHGGRRGGGYIEAAEDIDQVAARAKASGISLAKEPHDTDWGTRAFEVTEPSGFLLTIASTPKAA